MRRARPRRERRGAALIAALVTITLLASVTAIASSRARQSAQVADNRRAQSTARAMAESGVLAARAQIESRLTSAAPDDARLDAVFASLTAGDGAVLEDSIQDGVFATAVVDVSARLDVNTAGAEGMRKLLETVAPPEEADRVARAIEARVRGDGLADDAALRQRRERDSIGAALLGRASSVRAMQPFTSLDELLTVPGMQASWLEAIAGDVTVDGDGRVNRRGASPRVLAAATGTLVDRPSRLLLISRGWRIGHALTREIQAVFDVNGTELRLVRWREQDR